MEVMIPSEFNFDSTSSSTPQGFNTFFFSAPTTPTHFNWEQTPLTLPFSKNNMHTNDHNQDFEFDFTLQTESPSLSVDELFDCGKIKPIKLNQEFQTSGGQSFLRVSDILFEKENDEEEFSNEVSSSAGSVSSSSWCKRWKLKGLLLFRSALEGRGESRKDHLLKKSEIEEMKISIYRSTAVMNSVHVKKKRKEKGKSEVCS